MKTYILSIILSVFPFFLQAQLKDHVHIDRDKISFCQQDGYDRIHVENSLTTGKGQPELPVISRSFVIPPGATVTGLQVQTNGETKIEGAFSVYPVQPVADEEEGLKGKEFVVDSVLYARQTLFPDHAADLTFDGYIQGYRVVTVCYYPLAYIPAKKELYLRDISVTLDYTLGNNGMPPTSKISYMRSLLSKSIVKSLVENPEDIDACTDESNIVPQNTSLNKEIPNSRLRSVSVIEETIPDFVIITCDSLKETFQVLADWKIKRGIPTLIETTERINADYAGSDLVDKMRNYFRDVRQRWNADNLFILLGGDTGIVPSRMGKDSRGDEKYPNDLYFVAESDTLWNSYTDKFVSSDSTAFYIGRLPVENIWEAQQLIAKILSYEKADKNIDYSYFQNSLTAVGFHSIEEGKYNNRSINNIYKRCENFGYDFWYLFPHFNREEEQNVELSVYDTSKGEELNRANFVSALQDGRNSRQFHFVYHVDHSFPTSMGTSHIDKLESMTIGDVDNMTDTPYPKIFMTHGCRPAFFSKDCIAEHLLKKSEGGAVAFIGDSKDGDATQHSQLFYFLKRLFDEELVCKEQYSIGYLFNNAFWIHEGGRLIKDWQTGEYHSVGGYWNYYREWRLHLLGDPTMPVWTKAPQNLNVSVSPKVIQSGENIITVQVKNLPAGQQAMICLMKGEEGYATLLVEDTQPHNFTFTPRTSGVLDVTVTAHNFRPYETTIPVQANENAAVYISDLVFNDDKTGKSMGNGDGQLDAGEKVELTMTLKNSGKTAVNGIVGILTCNSPKYIHFIDYELTFGSIAAGKTAQSNTPFVFQIDPNTPSIRRSDLNNLKFTIQIRDNTNSVISTDTFKIDVFSPELRVGHQTVSSTMMPEINNLTVNLFNIGKAKATGLTATLEPDGNDSYVSTCSPSLISFPDIAKNESAQNSTAFQFQMKDSYREGQPLKMKLNVTNEFGKQWIFHLDPADICRKVDASLVKCESLDKAIEFRWPPVPGAVGYEIYRAANSPERSFSKLTKVPIPGTFYRDDWFVLPNTVYYYKIKAISASGNVGAFSDPIRGASSLLLLNHFPAKPAQIISNSHVSVADIDNDGYKEIICTGAVRQNENKHGFLSVINYQGKDLLHPEDDRYKSLFSFPSEIRALSAIGNLYGNGESYISVVSWEDGNPHNSIACLSGYDKDGNGSLDREWGNYNVASYFRGIALANVDKSTDGSMELIAKSHQENSIKCLNNQGGVEVTFEVPRSYSYVAVADLNGTGASQIVASNTFDNGEKGGFTIFYHDGFLFRGNPVYLEGVLLSSPVVCDLNRDGNKDIIVAERGSEDARIFALDLDGNLLPGWDGTQIIPYTSSVGDGLDKMISVGDINDDGYPEVASLGIGRIRAWNYRGELCLDMPVRGLKPNIEVPILADVDGDSQSDIVFYIEDKIYAINGESGTFLPRFPLQTNAPISGNLCVADINYNGKNELVAIDTDGYVYVWKTQGDAAAIEWGSERHDIQNTGEYAPICESMVITSNKTWNGETPCGNVIVRSGQLTIPSGQTLTLDPTALLAVRPGATLIVDGGTILNARIHALPGSTVILRNNGTIRLNSRGTFTLDEGAVLNQEYGTITP